MTVRELIELLSDCPPEAIVLFKETYKNEPRHSHMVVNPVIYAQDHDDRYIVLQNKGFEAF